MAEAELKIIAKETQKKFPITDLFCKHRIGKVIGAGVQEAEISAKELSALEKRLQREGAKRGSVQVSLDFLFRSHRTVPVYLFHDARPSGLRDLLLCG